MKSQNDRNGSNDAVGNQPAEGEGKQKSGGHMGAGRSGAENLGSEKPSDRDDMGSQKPDRKE